MKPINLRNEVLAKLNDDKFYQMPEYDIFKKQRSIHLDRTRYVLFNELYSCFYHRLYITLKERIIRDLNE